MGSSNSIWVRFLSYFFVFMWIFTHLSSHNRVMKTTNSSLILAFALVFALGSEIRALDLSQFRGESAPDGRKLQESASTRRLGFDLSGFSHTISKIKARELLVMDFKVTNPDTIYLFGLNDPQGNKLDGWVDYTKSSTGVSVNLYFPAPGKYSLWVFAKNKNDSGSYPGILNYTIEATRGISEADKFKIRNDPLSFDPRASQIISSPLNQRITTQRLALPSGKNFSSLSSGFGRTFGATMMRFTAKGEAIVGWSDDSYTTRFALVRGNVLTELFSIPFRLLEDFIIKDDQIAVLTMSEPDRFQGNRHLSLWFGLYNQQGQRRFENKVVGIDDIKQVNDQAFQESASIRWNGKAYAVFAATFRKWPDQVTHQGDYMKFYDEGGKLFPQGWDWGTSHSFDPLMELGANNQLILSTTGDAYPRGLAYRLVDPNTLNVLGGTKMVFPTSGEIGDNDAHHYLGSIVPEKEGFSLFFQAYEGRSSNDLALIRVTQNEVATKPIWITNTTQVQELLPKAGLLDEGYFVAYSRLVGTKTQQDYSNIVYGLMVNAQGKILEPETKLKMPMRRRTRMFTFPNGDLGWISDVSEVDALYVVRVQNKSAVSTGATATQPPVTVLPPVPNPPLLGPTPHVNSQPANPSQRAIQAVVNWNNGKLYFFKDNQYLRYDLKKQAVDNGYPLTITDATWPGLSFQNVDAALDFGNGKFYFFSGNQYTRYDVLNDRADSGYPQTINARNWPGLTFDSIDAAVNTYNGKAYLFKGTQYSRLDTTTGTIDPGYPKPISDSTWPGLTYSTIDDVMYIKGILYFFSGDSFTAYDFKKDQALSGYPKSIQAEWKGVKF